MKALLLLLAVLLGSCAPQIEEVVQIHDCTVYQLANDHSVFWTVCTGEK